MQQNAAPGPSLQSAMMKSVHMATNVQNEQAHWYPKGNFRIRLCGLRNTSTTIARSKVLHGQFSSWPSNKIIWRALLSSRLFATGLMILFTGKDLSS